MLLQYMKVKDTRKNFEMHMQLHAKYHFDIRSKWAMSDRFVSQIRYDCFQTQAQL